MINKIKNIQLILFFVFLSSISFSQTNAVTDLTCSSGTYPHEIKLVWTQPGPGSLPEGSNYYIQYATYTEISWSTSTAQVVISTSNVVPYQQQVVLIAGFDGGTTYYFHIWTSSGTEQLISQISNRATFYLQKNVLMEITKTYSAITKRPTDEITYFITYKNVGNSTATYVVIQDKIPTYTEYKPSSIKVNNIQKTDSQDEEEGPDAHFDNGIIFVIFDDEDSQIPKGGTGVVEFKVIIK